MFQRRLGGHTNPRQHSFLLLLLCLSIIHAVQFLQYGQYSLPERRYETEVTPTGHTLKQVTYSSQGVAAVAESSDVDRPEAAAVEAAAVEAAAAAAAAHSPKSCAVVG